MEHFDTIWRQFVETYFFNKINICNLYIKLTCTFMFYSFILEFVLKLYYFYVILLVHLFMNDVILYYTIRKFVLNLH